MVFINLVVFLLLVCVLIFCVNLLIDDKVSISYNNNLYENGILGYVSDLILEFKVVKFDFVYVVGLLMIIVWILIVSFVKFGKC